LPSYAFGLRKLLLQGAPLQKLLQQDEYHQQLLSELSPDFHSQRLSPADHFAWKFIQDVNILNPRFSQQERGLNGGQGIHQDLAAIVQKVQAIWFPEMKHCPRVSWLKRFSVRKLAHYSLGKDEIAFSLIFDFKETPAEILHYLAYHELLHRKLGVQRINGRRYAHTPEFKLLERQYPGWESIDQKIGQYIHGKLS